MLHQIRRNIAAVLAGFFLLFALAACSSEETERKAFIGFLQTRILDKKGLRVPTLTEDEKKSFGAYAEHYAIIANFNGQLDETVKGPMVKAMQGGRITSVGDLVARRKDIALMREGVIKLKGEIDTQLVKADAAKAALTQPEDLKPVFDAAYKRTVSDPAKLLSDIFPTLSEMLGAADHLAGWIEEHRSQVEINGMMVQVSDQKLLDEFNALVQKMQAQQKTLMDAQNAVNAMIRGQ